MLITARGVGLATLAPLVRAATRKGISVTAFLSYKGENSCIAQDEFKENGADVIVVTDEKGDSEVASLKKKIKEKHRASHFDFLATCGSNRLLRMSKELCYDWGIQGQVALESRMGCGIGMCFACVVPTLGPGGREEFKRVCLEGPVFNVNEVDAW